MLLVTALLLLLLTPARVEVRVTGDPAHGVEVAASWRLLVLRGERRRRLTLAPAGVPPAALTGEPAPRLRTGESTAATAARHAATPRAASSTGRNEARRDRRAELERTIALLRRLVERRAVRITRLHGWLEFALGDVAETGRAFGFACALATLVDPAGHLALQPRWDTENWLAADLTLDARLYPLRTLRILYAGRRALRASAPPSAASRDGDGDSLAA